MDKTCAECKRNSVSIRETDVQTSYETTSVVAYQIDENDEQNRMQVKFSSYGQTGDLGVRPKVKYHLISVTMSISKIFYTILCVCSHKLKIENILNRIFILLPGPCPRVGLRGAGGVKNFSVGICDGAPSTTRSSLSFYNSVIAMITSYN